ncbi:protachykinin [Brienomyrus brachyistius]|uniref:protachykinin n=1 Tax=Brienomyrus brachyistius TaxID=42636 RepID=UPI0020B2956F|nr:protachykinin [Brienomyrus brachyistius]
MKLLSAALLFLIMTEVFCEEYDPGDYGNEIIERDQIQDSRLKSEALNTLLRRAARKPRPQQFFGLMGRRSSRQKLNSFVGLMGKRNQGMAGLYEWNMPEKQQQYR